MTDPPGLAPTSAERRSVWILGNGVSIGFDQRLTSQSITTRSLQRLGDRVPVLRAIAALAAPDRAGPFDESNFEEWAGPLDRLGDALLAIEVLLSIQRFSTGQVPALNALREASAALRSEYLRFVGTVLQEIDRCCIAGAEGGVEHEARQRKRADLYDFADALIQSDASRSPMIFTLNYDSLMMAALLEKAGGVYDGFPFGPIDPALDWWGIYPALFHLHGSTAWVLGLDGTIAKKDQEWMRRRGGPLSGWAGGSAVAGMPLVVLGDLKTQQVQRAPFNLFYARLAQELLQTETASVVVAGYGFKDVPVNDVLTRYLQRPAPGRLIVGSRNVSREKVLRALRLPDKYADRIIAVPVELPSRVAGIRLASEAAKPFPGTPPHESR